MREEEDLQEPKKKFDEILRQQKVSNSIGKYLHTLPHFSHPIILPAK